MSIAAFALTSSMILMAACADTRAGGGQPRPEAFFKRGSFSARSEADTVMAERLTQVLRLMEESPLGDDGPPALRIVAMPTFGRPRAIRVEGLKTANPHFVYAQLTGRGGYELGELAQRREAALPAGSAEALRKDANTLRQWLMKRAGDEAVGFDGTTWLIEMRTDQGHVARTTWSPNGSLGSTLRAMMSTAGDACIECR